MTTHRFRVKYEYDPTSLWRDIAGGGDRTLDEFQMVLNHVVGLNQGHLWFFGTDQNYWDSDSQYMCPQKRDRTVSQWSDTKQYRV
jgi:hypothetical protein